MKKILVFALALVAGMAAFADWAYNGSLLSDGSGWVLAATASGANLTVTGVDASSTGAGALDLSQAIDGGQQITAIGANAFKSNTALTSIALPDTVISIGRSAFEGCSNLGGTVTLGSAESETAIDLPGTGDWLDKWSNGGGNQFKGTKIASVVLGKGVTTLPPNIFQSCMALTRVVFLGDVPTSLNVYAFHNCASYQMVWSVPSVASWIAYGNDTAQVTPWGELDTATKAKYEALAEEGETVKGVTTYITNAWNGENVKMFLAFQKSEAEEMLLGVVGEPSNIGVVSPAYGDPVNVADQPSLTFSAPEYVENGNTLWRCTGYRIDTLVDTDWVAGTPVDELSGSYTAAEVGTQRIVWLWEKAGFKVSTINLPEGLSMTASVQPTLQGYYPAGTVVTFTAAGDGFEAWEGDLADATIDGTQVTVVVDRELTIRPYFATPWVITGSTMTDGYWNFDVSVSGDEVSLTNMRDAGLASILDYTKPVVGGYRIVAVPGIYVKAGNPKIALLKELRFAGSIRNYQGYGFCVGGIKMTIPVDNDIRTIGEGAFNGANLCGDLNLDKATSVLSLGAGALTSVVFGRNLSTISLNGYSSLTSVVIRAASPTFAAGWSFTSLSSLREVTFEGAYPASLGDNWMYKCNSGTSLRFIVPLATESSWGEKASDAAVAAGTFTKWKNCSAEAQAEYFAAFGANAKKPAGFTTVPGDMWLVELRETGMMLLLK